jgi:hypothetical protein
MFKTYTIAEGGLPHVSLEYLTGAPSSSYSKQNYPELWNNGDNDSNSNNNII